LGVRGAGLLRRRGDARDAKPFPQSSSGLVARRTRPTDAEHRLIRSIRRIVSNFVVNACPAA
jgi:hypothetical protein